MGFEGFVSPVNMVVPLVDVFPVDAEPGYAVRVDEWLEGLVLKKEVGNLVSVGSFVFTQRLFKLIENDVGVQAGKFKVSEFVKLVS